MRTLPRCAVNPEPLILARLEIVQFPQPQRRVMNDPFFEAYDRDQVAYGTEPSSVLASYLAQVGGSGRAIDLGAGAGRDSLALAAAGYDVTSVDLSQRGLQRIEQRAAAAGLAHRISTLLCDVRHVPLEPNSLSAIVATTVLDHIESKDAETLWQRMTNALRPDGFIYCQVHTTDDPGCPSEPGCLRNDPISETAAMVINYFGPNQLVTMATEPKSRLRILRYEERLEWDCTHGPEHLHGKAVLLAVRTGSYPDWYGYPKAFPKR